MKTSDLCTDLFVAIWTVEEKFSQTTISEKLRVSKQAVNKRLKKLEDRGIISPIYYNDKKRKVSQYEPGLYYEGFRDEAEEFVNFKTAKEDLAGEAGGFSGANSNPGAAGSSEAPADGPEGEEESPRVKRKRKTLDIMVKRIERIKNGRERRWRLHNLQFSISISRDGIDTRFWTLPDLPNEKDGFDWYHNFKNPQNGNYHALARFSLDGWDDKVHVQYINSSHGVENLQVSLPVRYVRLSWIKDDRTLKGFLLGEVRKVVKAFCKKAYKIGEIKPPKSRAHLAFEVRGAKDRDYLRSRKISEEFWLDWSKDVPELETNSVEKAHKIDHALDHLELMEDYVQEVEELKVRVVRVEDELGLQHPEGEFNRFANPYHG